MDEPLAAWGVAHVERHAEIESTNTRAAALAKGNAVALPALVIAARQTAGRGRGANRWWSGEGALTFSLLLDAAADRLPAECWPLLSLATALAVNDALAERLPAERVQLKWPNDVYVSGKKICGILVEAPPARPPRLIVGVGLNVNNSLRGGPEEIRARATSLTDEADQHFDVEEILEDVVRRMLVEMEAVAQRRFDLTSRWDARCLLRGRTVRIDQAPGLVAGRCLGIHIDGSLRVQTLDGERRVYAGVVQSWE
jgi:BirA family biotin operon repressor/biotin-[acetyl-CoA-carboxylase] ligase